MPNFGRAWDWLCKVIKAEFEGSPPIQALLNLVAALALIWAGGQAFAKWLPATIERGLSVYYDSSSAGAFISWAQRYDVWARVLGTIIGFALILLLLRRRQRQRAARGQAVTGEPEAPEATNPPLPPDGAQDSPDPRPDSQPDVALASSEGTWDGDAMQPVAGVGDREPAPETSSVARAAHAALTDRLADPTCWPRPSGADAGSDEPEGKLELTAWRLVSCLHRFRLWRYVNSFHLWEAALSVLADKEEDNLDALQWVLAPKGKGVLDKPFHGWTVEDAYEEFRSTTKAVLELALQSDPAPDEPFGEYREPDNLLITYAQYQHAQNEEERLTRLKVSLAPHLSRRFGEDIWLKALATVLDVGGSLNHMEQLASDERLIRQVEEMYLDVFDNHKPEWRLDPMAITNWALRLYLSGPIGSRARTDMEFIVKRGLIDLRR